MDMRFNKLYLLGGFLAIVLASPVAHATKMLDKDTFTYDPGTSYFRSALNTRFSIKETEHRGDDLFPDRDEVYEVVLDDKYDYDGHHGSGGWDGEPGCVEGCGTHKIPEPGTLVLFAAGLFSLLLARKFRH